MSREEYEMYLDGLLLKASILATRYEAEGTDQAGAVHRVSQAIQEEQDDVDAMDFLEDYSVRKAHLDQKIGNVLDAA